MAPVRIFLNSLVLCLAMPAMIPLGATLSRLFGEFDPEGLRNMFASGGVTFIYVILSAVFTVPRFRILILRGPSELVATFFVALVLTPVIVVPLRFVSRGDLTALEHVYSLWLLQIPTNVLALTMGQMTVRMWDSVRPLNADADQEG